MRQTLSTLFEHILQSNDDVVISWTLELLQEYEDIKSQLASKKIMMKAETRNLPTDSISRYFLSRPATLYQVSTLSDIRQDPIQAQLKVTGTVSDQPNQLSSHIHILQTWLDNPSQQMEIEKHKPALEKLALSLSSLTPSLSLPSNAKR
jgi:hypothetical protein